MKKQDTKISNPVSGFTDIFSANGAASDAFVQMAKSLARDMLACQDELTRFVTDRWNVDLEFQKSLASCQSLSDVTKMQHDWITRTINNYSEQTAEIADLFQNATRDSFDSWSKILSIPVIYKKQSGQEHVAAE